MKKLAFVLIFVISDLSAIGQSYISVLDTLILHKPILLNRDGTYLNVKIDTLYNKGYVKITEVNNDLVLRQIHLFPVRINYFQSLNMPNSIFFNSGTIKDDFINLKLNNL